MSSMSSLDGRFAVIIPPDLCWVSRFRACIVRSSFCWHGSWSLQGFSEGIFGIWNVFSSLGNVDVDYIECVDIEIELVVHSPSRVLLSI